MALPDVLQEAASFAARPDDTLKPHQSGAAKALKKLHAILKKLRVVEEEKHALLSALYKRDIVSSNDLTLAEIESLAAAVNLLYEEVVEFVETFRNNQS